MKLADVIQLSGYQPIPPQCPPWKRALIEKKNAALLSESTVTFQSFFYLFHFHPFRGCFCLGCIVSQPKAF